MGFSGLSAALRGASAQEELVVLEDGVHGDRGGDRAAIVGGEALSFCFHYLGGFSGKAEAASVEAIEAIEPCVFREVFHGDTWKK